jgi:tRNA1Val (adenine37-N6)-methyltransferase
MKVGTDGVLLGAWAQSVSAENILDIGTGTGLIAIMLAQRTMAMIDAVEIEESSVTQAIENINSCKWRKRIKVHHISFQDFYRNSPRKYQLIVSNPPYFTNSMKAPDKNRTTARHTYSLPFEELMQGVSVLLADNGRFCLILPFEQGNVFIEDAKKHKLFCSKKVNVKPNNDKKPKRLLLEFCNKKQTTIESTLTIETEKRHIYSEDYKRLTKDFLI